MYIIPLDCDYWNEQMKSIAGGWADWRSEKHWSSFEYLFEVWPEFYSKFDYALIKNVDSEEPVEIHWQSIQSLPSEILSTMSEAGGGVVMPSERFAKLVEYGFFNGHDEVLFMSRYPGEGCEGIDFPSTISLSHRLSPVQVEEFRILAAAMKREDITIAVRCFEGLEYFTFDDDLARKIDGLIGIIEFG